MWQKGVASLNLFELYATIGIKMDEFEQGIDRAQKKFESFSDNISGLSGKIDSAYKGMGDVLKPAVDGFKAVEGVGKTAGNAVVKGLGGFAAASTAVAGFGAAAVKSGMQFDATMSEVSAISGATGEEFDALRDKALEMGAKTKFSASEAAAAMTYMGMAGWKSGDMIEGIGGIMNLAAASGEDLATTSDIVTDALTAFGKTAGDSGRLANIMAAASSNANTNVSMLGESFKYVAPVAGALSYSMEDTSLALGLMANAGIKGSQAGTALRSALTNMVKPTDQMAAVMDTYGISLTNADGSMMSLQEVMVQLREKMGGLDEATQASAASALFGKEAMSGMLAIINAAPEDFEKLTGAIYDCNGAAEEMAATMIDNLQGDLTLLGSAFESLQIAISDSLTPTLREFAQFGQKAMAGLLEGFQGGGVSGFMSALSGIVTEGVTMLAEKAPEFASVSMQFIGALGEGLLSAGPQILEATGQVVETIVTGVSTFLGEHGEEMAQFGIGMVNSILSGFSQAGDVISENIGIFIPLIAEAFLGYHETLFTVGMDILGSIGQGIIDNKDQLQSIASETITNMVTALRDNAPSIIEGGLALLEALVGAIEENMPLIIETGAVIIGKLIEGISTASPGVQAIIATAVLPHILKIVEVVTSIGGAVSSVASLASGAINTVIGIGGKLMGGISKLFGLIAANPVVAIITGIIAAVVLLYTKCEWFRDAVHAVIDAVVGFFQGAWDLIVSVWEAAGDFFGGIVDGIKSVFEGIGEFLGGLFTAAWEMVQGAWDAAVEFFSGVWEGIQGVFSVVADVLGGFFSAAWDAIKAVWDTVVGVFQGIADGIHAAFEAVTGFLGDAFSAAWDAISGVWDAAVGFFDETFGSIMDKGREAAEKVGDKLASAYNYVKEHWDEATPYFEGMWGNIQDVFGNAWDAFKTIGGNILEGLWNGIGDKVEWLKSKVAGVVDKIKSWFTGKDGFDEHSPSKWSKTVFYRVMQGGVNGLDDGESVLMREVNSISDKVKNGLNFGTATVGLSANYSSAARYGAQEAPQRGGAGWGNTYVTINSPVAVDGVQAAREWQKTAQRMALGYV